MFSKLIKAKNSDYTPLFFDIKNEGEKIELVKILESYKGIIILDEIESQLKELIKLKHPKRKLSDIESDELIRTHLGNQSVYEYGIWVYYSWLNKVVHLLPEEEFIEVRTNRNHYKITPEEEIELAQKKIGVIGLSVGKSIALTIALERICGELILADFDEIELSNLNRIQTGVQNLGVKKTIVVAREIAEIDPYLKVTCLEEGITEDNVDDFFLKGGKLSVCIEVCDGLNTKIFTRQKAKKYRVPVLMNSSDRGTTDIERFDLDPSLPILHGLIDHLDLSLLKEAKTNEEKVPYLLPMLGIETSSNRLKASMLEIEETITTWPQLASGVVFGGGICTDVCRRLLLGQIKNSGRYFVDIEEHINDEVDGSVYMNKKEYFGIPKTTIEDYHSILKEANDKLFTNENKNNENCELTSKEIEDLIEYALMAPSGGNIQPWKWKVKDKTLMMFNDVNRCKSILNYKNLASLISHGAATENIILKAHEIGYEVVLNKFPLGVDNDLISIFKFQKNKSSETEKHVNDSLIDFVPERETNRNIGEREALKKVDEIYFNELVQTIEGAELKLFKEPELIDQLKQIIAEVDTLFMTNKSGHSHFIKEIRWNKKEVELTRDGIDLNTIDLTPTERAGLVVAKKWSVTKYIKNWRLGNEFGKLSRKVIDASSSLGMIVMPNSSENSFFDGGRALQKLWLGVTEKGLAFQPISINTFLFLKIDDDDDEINEIREELKVLYSKMRKLCKLELEKKDVFFFRIAKADKPKIKALRREFKDVLI